jgi:bacterioferritin-associated ferredoxin
MYICICNALRDRDIARAVQGGAATVDEAYAACGTATACGQCREDAEAFIRGVATACCGKTDDSIAA